MTGPVSSGQARGGSCKTLDFKGTSTTTVRSLRQTVGMVTQDGHLFHDTVRENLRFARPEATDDELWGVLAQARLAEAR